MELESCFCVACVSCSYLGYGVHTAVGYCLETANSKRFVLESLMNELINGLIVLGLIILCAGMFLALAVINAFANPTPPIPREHSGRSDAQQEADQAASLQWWGDLYTGRWDSEDE